MALTEICAELDIVHISKVFMMLLSHNYINQNAPPEFHIVEVLQGTLAAVRWSRGRLRIP